YHVRVPPSERRVQSLRPEPHGKGVAPRDIGVHHWEPCAIDILEQPIGQGGRVTVVATGGYRRTSGYRIPRHVRPFDPALLRHGLPPLLANKCRMPHYSLKSVITGVLR